MPAAAAQGFPTANGNLESVYAPSYSLVRMDIVLMLSIFVGIIVPWLFNAPLRRRLTLLTVTILLVFGMGAFNAWAAAKAESLQVDWSQNCAETAETAETAQPIHAGMDVVIFPPNPCTGGWLRCEVGCGGRSWIKWFTCKYVYFCSSCWIGMVSDPGQIS